MILGGTKYCGDGYRILSGMGLLKPVVLSRLRQIP